MTKEQILEFINNAIVNEHGRRVTESSVWPDADVDSFGTTMVFCDMDNEYGCFDKDWFNSISREEWNTLTISSVIERVMNESTKL